MQNDLLDDFCDCMDQWSRGEGESLRYAFDLGKLLLKANQKNKKKDGSTRGIFIIGDQSSSKSTTVNSIIKQVALQMGNNTVTKIRTWIEHRYDSELKDAKYELLIEQQGKQDNPIFKDGTLQDLTREFTKLNKERMDDKKDARIIIHSNIPSFAIDCCDNPGLTPTSAETQKITDNITRRTLEMVLERQKSKNDSVVVLCISALVFENASWPRHMDLIEKINGDTLLVLITRMDQLNIGGIAQEMRADKGIINGLHRCSPLDILKYIRMKIERQAGSYKFPEGVQFYYVASSNESWDNLMENGWSAFEKSENENNKTLEKILYNEDEWRRYGIELAEMGLMQSEELKSSVGMKKLQERLQQTLHIHIVKAAEELIKDISERKSSANTELNLKMKRLKPSKDRAGMISEFCKQFILVFQTLFSSPLYTPTIYSDPWLKEFGEGIKRARETSADYGWSLKDMWEIFATLRGTDGYAEFPPEDFQGSNFHEYIEKIENYIYPVNDRFNTAQMLIQRLIQEFTMRSTLIDLPMLNVDEFVSRQVQASTSSKLSFGEAVEQKISCDYVRIFHESEKGNVAGNPVVHGGNQWVAIFGALCLLLHAEYAVRIMRDTAFSSLLQVQSDNPMQGILVSKFEQYWSLSQSYKNKNSTDKQSSEDQIANIMKKMIKDKMNSKKSSPKINKVLPIEDLSWALYSMFFEGPYNHFKKTFDARTDLLVMTHSTSLVHFYQLSGICVYQDEEYLIKWAADNPNSAYARAFLITEPEVKEGVEALSKVVESLYLTFVRENLQKIHRGKKIDNESKGKTEDYSDIFSNLSEALTERVRAIVKGRPIDTEDKVKLFVNLADMGKNPDTFEEPESKTRFSEKEEASVNYIYKRRLTMGITSSVIDATQQLVKVQYEYSHPQTAPTRQRELLGRVASLMLGYGYPYHPDSRPSSKWYLSLKVIVKFLQANEDVFEAMSSSPEEEFDYKDYKALLDIRLLDSPIVKRIISLCRSIDTDNNEHNFRTVSNYIKRLEDTKRDDEDAYIIEFLADERFNWQPDEESLKRRVDALNDVINKCSKWHYYLEEYNKIAEKVLMGKDDIKPEIDFNEEEFYSKLDESADEDDE
ncbi:5221_t:CDS:1 [Ambispora leptoticha]|uniref:5221_t:CDS:1 n=1 Tax=Ambispora leptoticha TaxID=144679 RepID=A0A9N9DHJ8_9GLOM|nr:5221_t:CDS:1 [Ambispora leptoticha]